MQKNSILPSGHCLLCRLEKRKRRKVKAKNKEKEDKKTAEGMEGVGCILLTGQCTKKEYNDTKNTMTVG